MTPSGNESVNFLMVHFISAWNEGYKFYVFFYRLQFFYFRINEKWGVISSAHQSVSGAKSALQLRYTWFPGMNDLLRFQIRQIFFIENLCDVSLGMHECVKVGVGLKNCSSGQLVTRAWIFLCCILALHWTKDINLMFFFVKFLFFYFRIDE